MCPKKAKNERSDLYMMSTFKKISFQVCQAKDEGANPIRTLRHSQLAPLFLERVEQRLRKIMKAITL